MSPAIWCARNAPAMWAYFTLAPIFLSFTTGKVQQDASQRVTSIANSSCLATVLRFNLRSTLALSNGNNEFQRSVRRGKADDFHVLQTALAAGGENVVFCDVFLALRINDPQGGRALHGF